MSPLIATQSYRSATPVKTIRPSVHLMSRVMMNLDDEKIDRAVLALLFLGLHEERRAWKGFDWDAMNRLHEKGYISVR
jgi:hypothetical protein